MTEQMQRGWVDCSDYRHLVFRAGERLWVFDIHPVPRLVLPQVSRDGTVQLVVQRGGGRWDIVGGTTSV